jgi:hypothetical protein
MANTKTVRLSTDQADWLESLATSSGISENKIVGMLIDRAREGKLTITVSLATQPAEAHSA